MLEVKSWPDGGSRLGSQMVSEVVEVWWESSAESQVIEVKWAKSSG